MNDKTERRVLTDQPLEIRKTDEGKERIEGYGIVFDRWSHNLGGFIERIDPSAAEGIDWNGVIASRNHNFDLLLGRVPKTMDITVDESGVRYSIDPPDTGVGKDTMEMVRRGDIDGSSFMFTVREDKWEKPENDGDPYKRTITKFDRVFEMGPVVGPAYPQTDATVGKRTLGLIRDEEEKEINEKLEQQRREQELIKIQQQQLDARLRLQSYNINLTDINNGQND
jgi:HK97 family phage prohead protease